MFGAPIWLRFGRIGTTRSCGVGRFGDLACEGGLRHSDMRSIAPLLTHGQSELVRGGITIRPATPDADAQSVLHMKQDA